MLLVLDTNILISALFWPGAPHRIWTAVRAGTVSCVTSQTLLEELGDVLTRSTGPFKLTGTEFAKVRRQVRTNSRIVRSALTFSELSDEPDNRILECAVAGRADVIVSGDAAMRRLRSFRGIRILGPRECWNEISGFPTPLRSRQRRR